MSQNWLSLETKDRAKGNPGALGLVGQPCETGFPPQHPDTQTLAGPSYAVVPGIGTQYLGDRCPGANVLSACCGGHSSKRSVIALNEFVSLLIHEG